MIGENGGSKQKGEKRVAEGVVRLRQIGLEEKLKKSTENLEDFESDIKQPSK